MSDVGKKLKRVARSKKSKAASKSKHRSRSGTGDGSGARTISQSILREHGAESSAFRQHLEQTWNLHASAVVDLGNAQKKEAALRGELSLAQSQKSELERRVATAHKRSRLLEEELSEVCSFCRCCCRCCCRGAAGRGGEGEEKGLAYSTRSH